MADEFGRDYRKVAGRLALGMDPPDPYVERLLDGFAFLAARIQLKLDAEFPRFVQSVVGSVCPHFLAPLPAMALVKFVPDWSGAALPAGYSIPRGTLLRGMLGKGETTPCTFSTAHDLCLVPIEIVEARYHSRDLETLALPGSAEVRAALRFKLRALGGLKFDQLNLDRLVFHLPGLGQVPGMLYEQILSQATGALLQSVRRPVVRYAELGRRCLRRCGLSDQEALLLPPEEDRLPPKDARLPPHQRTFSGYRLLQEYFAFPKRFLFFELTGLAEGLRRCPSDEMTLVIPLRQASTALEKQIVDASCFDLGCTPAINLFRKRGITVDVQRERFEYHVVPDRVKTLDYEVYELEEVAGVSTDPGRRPRFLPFYFSKDRESPHAGFYTTHRVPRRLTDRERRFGEASDYFGTDLYVSLVDAEAAPCSPDLNGLEITAWCTNRHLPKQLTLGAGPTDFTWDLAGPIQAVKCLARSEPKPSLIDGEATWKALSHLSLNCRPLFGDEAEQGAQVLRDLLRIYADPAEPEALNQLQGVRSARAQAVLRRLPLEESRGGPPSFARGLEITVGFDESPFASQGVFLLGSILEQFLTRYAGLNSFTETVIRTEQRGEIMRWPMQIGRRPRL